MELAKAKPHEHGQKSSIKPIGLFNLVRVKNISKFFMIIYL